MKKRVVTLLSVMLALSVTGCSGKSNRTNENNNTESSASNSFKAGTYTGSATGMEGEVNVEVVVDDSKILSVKVIEQSETYGIGYGMDTTPVEVIPTAVVECQGLGVDSVTGATITSAAIKSAIGDALTQAGGDVAALKEIKPNAKESKPDTYDVDVVVVGAGAAGLSAAIEAKEAGANVLVLEKQGIIGGATTRSGGKIMAAGTKWQEEQSIKDTPKKMFKYLKSIGGDYIDDEKMLAFCEDSNENLMWLDKLGVKVQDVEPIHSALTPYRVHNTEGGGGMIDGIGGQITVPLYDTYMSLGGQIDYNTSATELLTAEDGSVAGVVAERADGSKVVVNAKSVILCTGGYAQNREMMEMYHSFTEGYSTQVPKGNLGDGITMAETVGADIFTNPSTQVVYVSYTCGVGINEEAGLIVNDQGKRVVNEYTYQYHVADAISKTDSSKAYYIAASNDPNPTVQYGLTLDSTPKASSIEELAELIGMDKETLSETVARYNQLCEKGNDDDFGKPADKMVALEGTTFAAIELNPAVTVTYSGIVTDIDAHVLDADGNIINGLYAAGETAFPGLFGEEYPGCGTAIGTAVYYGRIAGENAAETK